MTYAEWIAANVITEADVVGRCAEVTAAMAAVFPELTRVRGEYLCFAWGPRSHWWLTAPDGTIVDPTASQFPSKGNGEYQPLPPDCEEPIGMCANCGELSFQSKGGGGTVCSDSCGTAYTAYLLGGGGW